MRIFRLFLSSPGDAAIERARAQRVVGRLNGEFAGLAQLQTVRWETEHYRAHATFQAQIPPAVDCEIVIGILRWRLGAPLPADFPDKLDGAPYPSGTAYEILTAIDKRKSAESPDIFVFRYEGGAPRPELGQKDYGETVRQWDALRGFFERWFVTPQGDFSAAFNKYESEDDFEAQLEILLRKWLAEKVSGGRIVPWPAAKGSPFRELGAFGAKHAPVFFGRAADIRRATDLWREAGAKGAPFLLIVGASGAGKSSLARAGLLPRLATPGVIADVDLWRIAAMRPGDSPGGPFATLAAALLQREADLPVEDEGRGAALPEIAEGDFKTPAALAGVFAHADASAALPILNALAVVASRVQQGERYGRPLRCDLILLVDQLDELFAASLAPDTRARFAELMARLAATGRVWIVATLRADLYAPMLETQALKALKDEGAAYDLSPPGAPELAEIVRAPAAAAALTFELDPATGERLDERLLREADRPDMLPLVQLALSRLWDARETRGGETVLTLAAFATLGGVAGIIDKAGERALAEIGEAERDLLAPLIRRLAELSREKTLTIRATPLAEAAPDRPARALVDALVRARLATLAGAGAGASLRLAHQRVLTDWARAARIVADSGPFYRIRGEIEDQRLRWEASKRRGELLLARGLPLAEARDMAARYRAELQAETLSFIDASRRRAGRAQALTFAAAALFAALAVGAGVAAKIAADQRNLAEAQRKEAADQKQIAERNFEAAKTTVDGLIFDIAEGLGNAAGMRVETIRTILETSRKTVDQLLADAPDDPQLLRSQAAMLGDFAQIYSKIKAREDAKKAAEDSYELNRKRLASSQAHEDLKAPPVEPDFFKSLIVLGDIYREAGDEPEALVAFRESLDFIRGVAAQHPDNQLAQSDLAMSLDALGLMAKSYGRLDRAAAYYEESVAVNRKLASENFSLQSVQNNIAATLQRIGEIRLLEGEPARAVAPLQESIDIIRARAEKSSNDTIIERTLSGGLQWTADAKFQTGDLAGALAAVQEAINIQTSLAGLDPGNIQLRNDLASVLEKSAAMKLKAGDQPGALVARQENLDILRRIAKAAPNDQFPQYNLAHSLEALGELKRETGDERGAIAALNEGIELERKLHDEGPDRNIPPIFGDKLVLLADADVKVGDLNGADAALTELARIIQQDMSQPADAIDMQEVGLAGAQAMVAVRHEMGDVAKEHAARLNVVEIARKLAERPPGGATRNDRQLGAKFVRGLGDRKRQAGDVAAASAAYEEADELGKFAADSFVAAREPAKNQARDQLAQELGGAAYTALAVKDFATALAFSDEAVALAPDKLWLETNRAHALMMLGRADEARALYLKYRGAKLDTGSWEEAIDGDFADLRKAGLSNPLMDEIEADFAKSATPN